MAHTNIIYFDTSVNKDEGVSSKMLKFLFFPLLVQHVFSMKQYDVFTMKFFSLS